MTIIELAKLFAEEARTSKSQRNIEDYFLLHLQQAKKEWDKDAYNTGWLDNKSGFKNLSK
jgi:hypothetical protein